MPRPTTQQLLQQLQGHYAQKELEARQAAVNLVIQRYPDYFPSLLRHIQTDLVLTEAERQQIQYGNCALVLKLAERYQEQIDGTAEAKAYREQAKYVGSNEKGLQTIQEDLDKIIHLARDDWVTSGREPTDFSLEQFASQGWSEAALAGFSSKTRKQYDPTSLLNRQQRVIPKKRADLEAKRPELERLRAIYLAHPLQSRLSSFQQLLQQTPECQAMYEATKLASECFRRSSSDGGFEQDVLNNPEVKAQWFPQLLQQLADRGLPADPEDLGFRTNIEYVVKHRVDHKQGKSGQSRYRHVPAEQDLVIYQLSTNRIVALIEIKSFPPDILEADYQIRRDLTMILGNAPDNAPDLFSDHLAPTVVDRFLAEKGQYTKPLHRTPDFQHDPPPLTGIITSDRGNLPGQLQVPSSLQTQMTHWLYSSAETPAAYLEQELDGLFDSLPYRSEETVRAERAIYVIHH